MHALAVERHPAPVFLSKKTSRVGDGGILTGSEDDTSLGVDLSGIVVGENEAIAGSAEQRGVNVVSDNATIDSDRLRAKLAAYIGRPISAKLIGEIRTEIVKHMRANNRPLVAVIVPPQEITGGTLRLVVMPFRVGSKKVERIHTEYDRTDEAEVLDAVRLSHGDEVAADKLTEDLNWLNRSPFRKVGLVFEQGRMAGETDLTLNLTDERPWRIYGGYSNGGTKATGYHRLFAGYVRELSWDALFSYQHTVSPTTLFSNGRLYNFTGDKAYASHAVSYSRYFANRGRLTVNGSYVRTRADLTNPFVQDSRIWEGSVEYARPASPFGPAAEYFFTAEAKRQLSELEFSNVGLGVNGLQIYQIVAGLRGQNAWGGHTLDYFVKGVFSPGRLTSENSDAAFAKVSGNAGDKARYAYVNARADYGLALPADFHANFTAAGQYASSSLPGLEKFAIGGTGTVRGYDTNEATGDHGLLLQAELHLPTWKKDETAVDLFAFTDFGRVYNFSSDSWTTLASAGLGVNSKLTENASLSLIWGHAFKTGSVTSAGSNHFHLNFTATY